MHNLQNKYYLTLYSLSEISWITPTNYTINTVSLPVYVP